MLSRIRKTACFISLAATAATVASTAMAELKYDNASGGHVLLYGQFNPAYQGFDDGVSTTGTLVDSGHSNSRVGLWLRQPMGDAKFSFNFETGLGLRPSGLVSQGFTPDTIDWSRSSLRKIDFALETARAGKFYLGQGSMATDGAAESDLSGTTLVLYVSVPDSAGGFRFRDSTGALSTRFIAGNFSDFDGGRRGRIRYDTPEYAGFTLSVAYGEEILLQNSDLKTRDIALRYNRDLNGTKVQAAVGYKRVSPGVGSDFDDTIGSVSVLMASGFNVTLAAGRRSTSGHYTYGKLGYRASWFNFGDTALAIDYYQGSDRSVAGSTSTAYGIGIVQKIDAANAEAYLGLRNYALSEPTTSYLDASSILLGARWKF